MTVLNSNLNRLVTKITESNLPIPAIVGIDGYMGSGKSRLAKALESALEASWVDTRPYQQEDSHSTNPEEWFNSFYNWPKLHDELIKPFIAGKTSKFCSDNQDKKVIQLVRNNPIMVVEGPYLYHPDFASFIHFWIFIDVPRDERRHRFKADGKDETKFKRQEVLEQWHQKNIFKQNLFHYIHTVL